MNGWDISEVSSSLRRAGAQAGKQELSAGATQASNGLHRADKWRQQQSELHQKTDTQAVHTSVMQVRKLDLPRVQATPRAGAMGTEDAATRG